MTDDVSINDLFGWAKKGKLPSGGEFPPTAVVYFTTVRHNANLHPSTNPETVDLVNWANGPMTLSPDKKTLTGEGKLWSDRFSRAYATGIVQIKEVPEAAFLDDSSSHATVTVTVTDTGQATFVRGVNGNPIGGSPAITLVTLSPSSYSNGLFAHAANGESVSLSFTLGTDQED